MKLKTVRVENFKSISTIRMQGRRVARKVDGTTTNRFLYGQGILPIAELNADNSVKSQFVFASKAHVPDYTIKNGVNYRIVTDQTGSVRLVVNATDGTIAQRIDYDPFGKVASDTNPGFQPFGFAGGLYDPDTGLTRFGARDYDAEVGRWTAKDPILFGGGDTNIYFYSGGDPINAIDPLGLGFCILGHDSDGSCHGGSDIYNWDSWEDVNDSVGGLVDGITHIPFTDTSLMEQLRNHMVDGGIATDVNVCSWGYGYANRIGQLEQAGLFAVGYLRGAEITFGRNFRIAPFGNRTGHPVGRYPHYHRRYPGPGGGIGRHRPWEGW